MSADDVLRAIERLREEVRGLREDVTAQGAAARQKLEAFLPPPAEQLVTLDQMAAIVNLSKRSMERHRKGMPPPRVRGAGGRPSRWAWSDVRPWLERQFGRTLPECFPAYSAG